MTKFVEVMPAIETHPSWINVGIFSDQSTGLSATKRHGCQAMAAFMSQKEN